MISALGLFDPAALIESAGNWGLLIVAAVIFIAVKAINRLQAAPVAVEQPAAPAEPPRQEALLEEIRDLLKQTR
jgi:large-conductance mechanosensitive channel